MPGLKGVSIVNAQDRELRKRVAALARALLERKIPHHQFMSEIAGSEDEDISDLEYLVEHIPARGGFLGASEKQFAHYMAEIEAVIRKLETA